MTLKKLLSPLNILKIAGVYVFMVLIIKTDLRAVRDQILLLFPQGIQLVMLMVVAQTLMKFFRWHILLKMINRDAPPVFKSFCIYYNGFFWGAVTPGKLGELVKVFLLSSESVPATSSILAIVIERSFDVLCALIFAVVFLPLCLSVPWSVFIPVVLLIAIFFIFLFFLLKEAAIRFIFNTIAISMNRRGGITVEVDKLRDGMKSFMTVTLWSFGILTIIYWCFTGLMFFVVLTQCGVNLSFPFVLVSHSLVLLGVMMPITILGVGIREIILNWLMGQIGHPIEHAILYSFLILALMIFQAGIGAIGFLFSHSVRKEPEAEQKSTENQEPEIIDSWRVLDEMRERAEKVFDKEQVCVVIPTKNEAATIEKIIEGVRPYAGEILVIDGHSTDDTIDIVKKYGLRYLLDEGRGKGCALRQAIREIEKPIIVFIDADGSHNPRDIPLLVMPILKGEADHVTGSRNLAGSDELSGTDMDTFLRLLGSEFVTLVINFRFGTRLTDSQNGFRAIRSAAAKTLPLKEDLTTIEQEMIIKTLAAGYIMAEVPTHEFRRWAGESKISLKNVWFRYVYTALKYCLIA